jgi:hypothetical protein
MAQKSDKSKGGKGSGILAGIPFGIAMDVVDSLGASLFKLFLQRYQVEEKIEKVKEDAKEKAKEIKAEAIKTGYALKRAFFITVIQAIILGSAILALIIGLLQVVQNYVANVLKQDPAWVLVAYGGVVILGFVLFVKLRPDRE